LESVLKAGGAIVHGMSFMEWNRMGGIYWNEGKPRFHRNDRMIWLMRAWEGEEVVLQ